MVPRSSPTGAFPERESAVAGADRQLLRYEFILVNVYFFGQILKNSENPLTYTEQEFDIAIDEKNPNFTQKN